MEWLELGDGQSTRLRVVSWERGRAEIMRRRIEPVGRAEIPVLRIHLWGGYGAYPPMYYDLASRILQAQLLPMLLERGFENWVYVKTRHGEAPKARYTVEKVPL
jgi:hypothetical protein